ncbi:MAG: hypothetical protein N3A72_12000 [bacterium]|nr:hypothetical protein [bacterium]
MQSVLKEIDGYQVRLFSIGAIQIGIATEFGPRIVFLAHQSRSKFNMFGVLPEAGVQTSEGFWHIYGGHRLWSSPESTPRTYSLDDKPIKIVAKKNQMIIYGNPEPQNSIQKKITIRASKKILGAVDVVHSITNIGRWKIQLACWALSVMRQNGIAIIPMRPEKVDNAGLLPDRHLSLWPYTSLADRRLTFLDEYILVKQDRSAKTPIKLGTFANPGWIAYWVDGMLFVKYIERKPAVYPDFGANIEVYTNSAMLEIETLGALTTVNPNQTIEHTETWNLYPIRTFNLDTIVNRIQ